MVLKKRSFCVHLTITVKYYTGYLVERQANITDKNDDIIFACRAIIPVYARLSVYYGAMSGNVATRSTTPVQAICTNKIGLHHH